MFKGHRITRTSEAICLEGLSVEGDAPSPIGTEVIVAFDSPWGEGRIYARGRIEGLDWAPLHTNIFATGEEGFAISFHAFHKAKVIEELRTFVGAAGPAAAPVQNGEVDLADLIGDSLLDEDAPAPALPPTAVGPAPGQPAAPAEDLGATPTPRPSGSGRGRLALIAAAAGLGLVSIALFGWSFFEGGESAPPATEPETTALAAPPTPAPPEPEPEPVASWECAPLSGAAPSPMPAEALGCAVGMVGEAQVRRAGTEAWVSLREGEPLRQGDQVRGSEGGRVSLRLSSGELFELDPGAAVRVAAEESEAGKRGRVEVVTGAISATLEAGGSQAVVAEAGGEPLRIESDPGEEPVQYRMTSREDGSLEVAVRKGSARLVDRGGRSVSLVAGKAQDVAEGSLRGEALTLPDFPQMVSPGVDATLTFEKDLETALEWRAVKGAASYRVEVAVDQGFRNLRFSEVVKKTGAVFRPTEPGVFYWRVAARNTADREGEFGFNRRLYVVAEDEIDYLVAPAADARVAYLGPSTEISFSWRAAVGGSRYNLIVDRDPGLEGKAVRSVKTEAQEVRVRNLRPGVYFWGVFLDTGEAREPLFTTSRKLTVKKDKIQVPKRLKWD
ncbi:MAG: hypothetical protein P1V51_11080 [Deltaproteobacteria bacterium]|nr:hypothetical protein [Deltaproteobacteria bacterium]